MTTSYRPFAGHRAVTKPGRLFEATKDNSYNPRTDDEVYLGTALLDQIEQGVTGTVDWFKDASKDQEGIGDDILRLLGGGLINTATAISYIPGIKQLGELEDWIAAQARVLNEQATPWLDPRFAGWGSRIATGIATDKGIGLAGKGVRAGYNALGKSLMNTIDDFTGLYDIGTGINKAASDYGRPWSRYRAALARLTKEGVVDQHGNLTGKGLIPSPPKTSRRVKAKRINPNSTHRIFAAHSSSKSSKIIDRWLQKLTPKEIDSIGVWQRHHRRPLDQNDWLLKGLPDNELLTAQKYQAGRMRQGGDVIQNLMPAPGKAHSYIHDEILDLLIGPKGAQGGRSIGNLLDDIDIDTYLSIDTFAGRKKYIDKFFDATDRADQKLGEILKAIDANRTSADVPIEKLVEINSRIAKGEETLLGVLDEVLEDIHRTTRLADKSSTIWNINQKINELLDKQNEVMIHWSKKFAKSQNIEPLSRASDRIDDMIEKLRLERWYLENK